MPEDIFNVELAATALEVSGGCAVPHGCVLATIARVTLEAGFDLSDITVHCEGEHLALRRKRRV